LESARAIPGVKEIVLKVVPGEVIRPLSSAFDRVGYVTAIADTATEAYSICCEAMKAILFEVEPVDSRVICRVI
jgi:hypothetical protein